MITSCSAPSYLSAPQIDYPYIKNTYTLGIQNMDEEAKVEEQNLTCHYENFDIRFKLIEDFIITFEITNKSNKSMIIDKSKCYVLRDGYATELFKDARSTRSTTFNNVQDAINNVQTNEGGVSMTIPPYSKFAITLNETNIKSLEKRPKFVRKEGTHPLTQYDGNDVTEFIIPYSFDYSLAEWSTCRNRVYFNSVISEKITIASNYNSRYPYDSKSYLDNNRTFYYLYKADWNTPIDYTEANRIDDINVEMYKKHRRNVIISHICFSPVTIAMMVPLFWIPLGNPDVRFGCHDHYPTIYGNKYEQRNSGKVKIRDDYKE